MKYSAAALLALLLVGTASAKAPVELASINSVARPQLSIQVRDGSYDGLDGLDPTVSWESSTRLGGDVDVSYGIKAAARPTRDIASLPRSIWGRARTDVAGWGVSAKAQIEGLDFFASGADVDLDAENAQADVSVHVAANTGGNANNKNGGVGFNVRSIEATKGFEQKGGRVTVTPRFNLEDDSRDVIVNYNNDNTNVKLTASATNQEVTISQQIDGDNRIAPTINSRGDISVEWERRLSDDSSLTANLRPNDSLNVEWRDSAWTANVNMPIEGTNINGANVSIKRDVSF